MEPDKELWVHIFIVAVKLITTVVDAEFTDNISKIVITLFTNFLNRTMSFFKKTEVQNLIWRYSNSCGVIVETNKKWSNRYRVRTQFVGVASVLSVINQKPNVIMHLIKMDGLVADCLRSWLTDFSYCMYKFLLILQFTFKKNQNHKSTHVQVRHPGLSRSGLSNISTLWHYWNQPVNRAEARGQRHFAR